MSSYNSISSNKSTLEPIIPLLYNLDQLIIPLLSTNMDSICFLSHKNLKLMFPFEKTL